MNNLDFSSNEIFNIARGAIRGAGWAQGVAEDGARAAVFLVQIGLDGIKATIEAIEDKAYDTRTLQQGLAAIDCLLSGESAKISLNHLDTPLLQWGLCCIASHETGLNISVGVKEDIPILSPKQAEKILLQGSGMVMRRGEGRGRIFLQEGRRVLRAVAIDQVSLEKAQQLAHNTYVPASASSRCYGAGSAKSDND